MGLKRLLINWLKRDWYNETSCELVPTPNAVVSDGIDGLTFVITKANGGTIVKFARYCDKKHETIHNIHVIPESDDFKESLVNIMYMEMLRN